MVARRAVSVVLLVETKRDPGDPVAWRGDPADYRIRFRSGVVADSQRIVFRSEGMYSVSPMDGQPTGGSTLWVVNRDGSGLRQLTHRECPRAATRRPTWGADGRILFRSYTRLFYATVWSVNEDAASCGRWRCRGSCGHAAGDSGRAEPAVPLGAQDGQPDDGAARLRDRWHARSGVSISFRRIRCRDVSPFRRTGGVFC